MAWSYSKISLDEFMILIKGFIDIIILSSGYQSTGADALWDEENIKKAIRWGLFFENIMNHLNSSDSFQDSIKELDAVLLELKTEPHFPKGLQHLSSESLLRGRYVVIKQFLQTIRLKDSLLTSILTATSAMDLDGINQLENNCLNLYIEKLNQQKSICHSNLENALIDTVTGELNICSSTKEPPVIDDYTSVVIKELLNRQGVVSYSSLVEICVDTLSQIVTGKKKIENMLLNPQYVKHLLPVTRNEETLLRFYQWNQWRLKCLSYLLGKRANKLVSGAKLIFSAPRVQWLQIFETLKHSAGDNEDTFLEIIELALIGLSKNKWITMIQHLMSISYTIIPPSKLYSELNDVQGRYRHLDSHLQSMNLEENNIIQYLTELLRNQLHHLWRLPPVLAAAIPPWSAMFRLYMNEIEKQIRVMPSIDKLISENGKEHNDSEIAERIWCLHAFHIQNIQFNNQEQ